MQDIYYTQLNNLDNFRLEIPYTIAKRLISYYSSYHLDNGAASKDFFDTYKVSDVQFYNDNLKFVTDLQSRRSFYHAYLPEDFILNNLQALLELNPTPKNIWNVSYIPETLLKEVLPSLITDVGPNSNWRDFVTTYAWRTDFSVDFLNYCFDFFNSTHIELGSFLSTIKLPDAFVINHLDYFMALDVSDIKVYLKRPLGIAALDALWSKIYCLHETYQYQKLSVDFLTSHNVNIKSFIDGLTETSTVDEATKVAWLSNELVEKGITPQIKPYIETILECLSLSEDALEACNSYIDAQNLRRTVIRWQKCSEKYLLRYKDYWVDSPRILKQNLQRTVYSEAFIEQLLNIPDLSADVLYTIIDTQPLSEAFLIKYDSLLAMHGQFVYYRIVKSQKVSADYIRQHADILLYTDYGTPPFCMLDALSNKIDWSGIDLESLQHEYNIDLAAMLDLIPAKYLRRLDWLHIGLCTKFTSVKQLAKYFKYFGLVQKKEGINLTNFIMFVLDYNKAILDYKALYYLLGFMLKQSTKQTLAATAYNALCHALAINLSLGEAFFDKVFENDLFAEAVSNVSEALILRTFSTSFIEKHLGYLKSKLVSLRFLEEFYPLSLDFIMQYQDFFKIDGLIRNVYLSDLEKIKLQLLYT